MAFDLKKLFADLGMSAEEQATVTAVLDKPERLTTLEQGFLRQDDYSRHMNALTKAQGDLKTSNDRLTAEMAEWATLTAAEKAKLPEVQKALDTEQQRVFALTQKVSALATELGKDPKLELGGDPPVKPESKVADPPDMSKYVPVDQFGRLTDYLLTLPAELQMIAQEHFALTGDHLDTRVLIAEIRKNSSDKNGVVDPRAIWEGKYDIPAKRDAKAKAAYDTEIKAAEARGAERALTEASVPGAHTPAGRSSSPLFARKADGSAEHASVLKRPAPNAIVARGVGALRSGKYREKAS